MHKRAFTGLDGQLPKASIGWKHVVRDGVVKSNHRPGVEFRSAGILHIDRGFSPGVSRGTLVLGWVPRVLELQHV